MRELIFNIHVSLKVAWLFMKMPKLERHAVIAIGKKNPELAAKYILCHYFNEII